MEIYSSASNFVIAFALCVSICSCGRKSDSSKKVSETGTAQAVKTTKAQSRPMERKVTVTGSFHAHEQATLTVKSPGRLQRVAVDVGSVVKKSDLLAQIDRGDYELRVKQAEAALAQARARVGLPLQGDDDQIDLEKTGTVLQAKALFEEATKNRKRIRELTRDKISSQSELDTVEAAYTVASSNYQTALEEARERLALVAQRRAEFNLAQKQLTDASVHSPFDGIIQQRNASIGEFLQTGTPLMVIANLNPLRLRLEVPERDALEVLSGQPMRIAVGASSNIYSAEIARVSPMLSESNRMLTVEADVPAKPELRPGLFAEATIIVSKNDPALAVPESAIRSFVGLEKVFVVQQGKALEKSIRTGRRSDGFVEILSGVNAGDVVILNPGKIRSGQAVIEEADAKTR
ncbi:MAG: efflux RND transporter periplasmic adaptor subunit [Verrucomicrobiota bacterium]